MKRPFKEMAKRNVLNQLFTVRKPSYVVVVQANLIVAYTTTARGEEKVVLKKKKRTTNPQEENGVNSFSGNYFLSQEVSGI